MDKKIFMVVVSVTIGNIIGYKIGYYQGYNDGYNADRGRINWFKYCVFHKEGV